MNSGNRNKSLLGFVTLLFGVLCFSIVSQILGLPLSFSNLEGTSDLLEAPQMEGLSMVSSYPNMTPTLTSFLCLETSHSPYRFLSTRSFFRPPLSV